MFLIRPPSGRSWLMHGQGLLSALSTAASLGDSLLSVRPAELNPNLGTHDLVTSPGSLLLLRVIQIQSERCKVQEALYS